MNCRMNKSIINAKWIIHLSKAMIDGNGSPENRPLSFDPGQSHLIMLRKIEVSSDKLAFVYFQFAGVFASLLPK